MKIVVYCSSMNDLESKYENTAQLLGEWIGKKGNTLVYGGVNKGLMHILASSASKNGAEILGVIPQRFEHFHEPLSSTTILVSDLSERKEKMMELGDIFVVLPGGIGTIDEWITTLSQLKVAEDKQRKIIVVNIDGMYDAMVAQLHATAHSPFSSNPLILQRSIIVDSKEKMIDELNKICNPK